MGNKPSIAVIIPTFEEQPITLNSIPSGVKSIETVSEGTRSEARNLGASQTTNDILVFCDDDIRFSETFFWNQVNALERGTISGLKDFTFGLLLTRFLVIHREDFELLGGFDENLNHKEDTELCLRAKAKGMSINTIPRDAVYHYDHDPVGKGLKSELLTTFYLFRKYPRFSLWIMKKYLHRIEEKGVKEAIRNAMGKY